MAVTPLRMLSLKKTNPAKYNKALDLSDNLESLKEKENWDYYVTNIIEPIMKLNIENVSIEDVERVVGIILTNSFETSSTEGTVGVFPEPAMMNHSCVANTRLVLEAGGSSLKVVAALRIKKGCQVSNNYARAIDTTWTRRVNLLENKCFLCQCERCQDPSELGSHVSSLRCGECEGDLLPRDTLTMRTDWQCSGCAAVRTCHQVTDVMKAVRAEAEKLNRTDVNSLKSLLKKLSKKVHRNHSIMLELKQLLVSGTLQSLGTFLSISFISRSRESSGLHHGGAD